MLGLGHRQGMTLIELMVAVGVATLVFAAAVSVFLVISRSLHRPLSGSRETAYAVLEQLRNDLTAGAQSVSTTMPACVVDCPVHETNTPGMATLALTVGRIPVQDEDFSRLETGRVRYGVMPAGAAGGRLMRETMTLWGPEAMAPAVSNAVMEGVVGFEVAARTETGWTNAWTSSARTLFPRAVRVRLEWLAGATSETAVVEIFIPAGNPVPGTRPGS